MPNVRDLLADRQEGLGIPLDFSVDPLTVVARGASIFASTQRATSGRAARPPATSATWTLDLEYKATGPDVEFDVGGRLLAPESTMKGYSIEFLDRDRRPACDQCERG